MGGENYRCERDCECFRRWSYTGGREPLSLFTGEGCILMWHASKLVCNVGFDLGLGWSLHSSPHGGLHSMHAQLQLRH